MTAQSINVAIALASLTAPAWAGPSADFSGNTVSLSAPTEPGAVARLDFWNDSRNGQGDTGATREIEFQGVGVTVTFEWNVTGDGSDRIYLDAGASHIAVPNELTVREWREGVAHIYPLQSAGF